MSAAPSWAVIAATLSVMVTLIPAVLPLPSSGWRSAKAKNERPP